MASSGSEPVLKFKRVLFNFKTGSQACFDRLGGSRADLITTTFVLLECGNAAARRPYRSTVNRLRQQMDRANRLIAPTGEDWHVAWVAYESGEADCAGIVDHVSFAVSATDSDLPIQPLTFTLEPGAPSRATIDPATGAFSWTPSEEQGPSTNTITVRVTDTSSPPLTATRSFTVVVREVNRPPVLDPIGPQTVVAGQLLRFTITAQDLDRPANELTYSLEPGAPAGATIDAQTGLFSWTPGPVAAGTTNSITVKLTDNGSPALSHTAVFPVVVTAPAGPKLLGSFLPNGEFELTLNSEIGRIYLIQASADLVVWEPVTNILSTAATIRISDAAAASLRQRFYRALSP